MITVLKQMKNSSVSKTYTVDYQRKDKILYEEMFRKHKDKGIITNCSFDDKKWTIVTGEETENILFNFNEIRFEKAKKIRYFLSEFDYDDLILSVKAYILYQMDAYSSHSFKRYVSTFKRMLNLGVLESSSIPDEKWAKSIVRIYRILEEYFMFIGEYYRNDELFEDFEDKFFQIIADDYNNHKSGLDRRALPSMETMFKFNDIIQIFIDKPIDDDDHEKKKELKRIRERYFPVILWWKITSVIPLRTQEFTLIPKNCLFYKNGKRYITFYRNDIKGGVSSNKGFDHSFEACYKEDECPISEEIAILIGEYLSLVEHYDNQEDFNEDGNIGPIERKFMLSYRSYRSSLKIKTRVGFNDRNFLSKRLLRTLLKDFLVEIVNGEYGIEIIPKSKKFDEQALVGNQLNDIALMDTRHFAIMNLVYMSYEPATIQRMAGHKTLHQSLGYYKHPEVFTNCYILSVAKQMAFKKDSVVKNAILDLSFSDLFGAEGSGNERFRLIKSKRVDKTKKYKQLTNGVCTYEKDDLIPCKLYRGKHERCRFFSPNKTALSLIDKELQVISDEIGAELKTLSYLVENKNTLIGFKEQYKVSMNKFHSKMRNQAEMISDYIICGVEGEE
jgi:hypothetical protein